MFKDISSWFFYFSSTDHNRVFKPSFQSIFTQWCFCPLLLFLATLIWTSYVLLLLCLLKCDCWFMTLCQINSHNKALFNFVRPSLFLFPTLNPDFWLRAIFIYFHHQQFPQSHHLLFIPTPLFQHLHHTNIPCLLLHHTQLPLYNL